MRRRIRERGVLLAVEQAQRVLLQAPAGVGAESIPQRCVVGDERLAIARPVRWIAKRVDLNGDAADPERLQEANSHLDDLRVEMCGVLPDAFDAHLLELP